MLDKEQISRLKEAKKQVSIVAEDIPSNDDSLDWLNYRLSGIEQYLDQIILKCDEEE